jgi:hypothetical protein
MPSNMGGFDLGEALQTYGQTNNFMEQIRKRREEAEMRKRQQENPAPDTLLGAQKFRQGMGENWQEDPAVMGQVLNLHAPQGGYQPGQREQIEGVLNKTPSLAVQRRKQDFRKELSTMMGKMADTKSRNAFTMATMMKDGDPSITKLFTEQSRIQEQELLGAYRRAIQLGYQDILNDPEVQGWLNQALIEGVLGPGSSPTAAPGGGVPATPQVGGPNVIPMPPGGNQTINRALGR